MNEEADEDTFEWSSEEDEDQHRPSESNEEESDEGAEGDASKESSDEEEELRRSSGEMANEDVLEVFSDDEDYRPSEFRGRDELVYMHYPNLAMLQKSAEYCQSCHVLMHSLRSHNKNLEEFLDQAQALEAQRLKTLQIRGDRAQSAVLDEDESDPNLESALRIHAEVRDDYGTYPLSPEEHGDGRLFLSFSDEGLDCEFIQFIELNVFCKPTESSASGHLESDLSFLASPGECEVACSQPLVKV